MYRKFLFSALILGLVGFVFFFHRFTQTNDLLKKYQKFGLLKSDLHYEKVEKSWGEQGLIFYQIEFPMVDIPVKAKRMNISLKDTGMDITLKNLRMNVTEGLHKLYGSKMANELNEYVPYRDFMGKMMTSMALMGIKEFVGDVSINTFYGDAKTMRFKVNMTQNNQQTLLMTGVIHIPIIGAHQLSDLWQGQVESAEVHLKDSLAQKYINYAKSRRVDVPSNWKKTIFKLKRQGQDILQLKNIFR